MNKQRREYANKLARRVSKILGISTPPKCVRITSRRGHAHTHLFCHTFSVPKWIFDKHPSYRDYYIAHEVCHFHSRHPHHGPGFHLNEQIVAEKFGVRLIHERQGKGPYLSEIRDLDTGLPICDQYGRCVVA